MTRRYLVLPAALFGTTALIATGCAASSSALPAPTNSSTAATSSSSATPLSTTPTATSAATNTTSSTANVSVSSSSAAGIAECNNGDVHVTSQDGGAASGHVALILQFTNVSGHSCFLQGYPGATLFDASGHSLDNAQRTLHGFIGSGLISATDPGITAPPRVTLGPGRDAIAELEWEDNGGAAAPGNCLVRQSTALRVTPPDSTASTALPGLSTVCAGFEIGPVLKDNAAD